MDETRSTDDHEHDGQDQQDADDVARTEDQRWTPLAAELRRLRADAGDPSFQTVAARVRDRRLATGVPPAGARVARSTVYDCFRDGRTRMSLPLVREIALALGVDEDGVDDWVHAARTPAVDPSDRSDPEVAPAAPASPPAPPPADHSAAVRPTEDPDEPDCRPGPRAAAALLAACVVLNLAGLWFVAATDLPFFLDMAGTAVAAIALGPWRGVGVAVVSSAVGLGTTAPAELPFVLVNVTGALLWGYGVRSWGMGRTLPRFLGLNVLVALACTTVAVPVLLLVAGTQPRGPQDQLAVTLAVSTGSYVLATIAANLVSSLVDKTASGFVALVAVSALPPALRRGCGLVVADDCLSPGPARGGGGP